MNPQTDDYYYGDGGFSPSDVTAVDPGPSIFIATLVFCVSLYAFLPCVLCLLDRKLGCQRKSPRVTLSMSNQDGPTSEVQQQQQQKQKHQAGQDEDDHDSQVSHASFRSTATSVLGDILDAVHESTGLRGQLTGRRHRNAYLKRATELDSNDDVVDPAGAAPGRAASGDNDDQTFAVLLGRDNGEDEVDDSKNENSKDHETTHRYQNRLGYSRMQNRASKSQRSRLKLAVGTLFGKLLSIVEFDKENKKIYKLALPYVLQAIVYGIAENGVVIIIAQLIGTREVSAYAVVDLLVGLTNQAVGGVRESLVSLISYSRGTENPKLTGEYVQIATVLYVILSIPFIFMWYFVTDDILLLFGFDQRTAEIGKSFVTPYLLSKLVNGTTLCLHVLLDVFDRAYISSILVCMGALVVCMSILLAALFFNPSLETVGYINLFVEILMLILTSALIGIKGWFQPFYGGMFRSFAFANTTAVKMVLKIASSLAAGYLLTYGEWEILAVFASFLGPAEVAAWSLLGTLWCLLEHVTEAIGNASEVRVALLLGSGQPGAAKKSAYKSIFLAFIVSLSSTSIIFILAEEIPQWLTTDPILQSYIAELIPLFGLGNISLTMGSMAWTLVGAQNRYRLATAIGIAGSWLITLPMAAVFSVVYRIDLQGQTAAVVIGYMVSGFVTNIILLRSDWKKLSDDVILYNADHDIELSDDDSSDDDSSHEESSSSRSSLKNPPPPLIQRNSPTVQASTLSPISNHALSSSSPSSSLCSPEPQQQQNSTANDNNSNNTGLIDQVATETDTISAGSMPSEQLRGKPLFHAVGSYL